LGETITVDGDKYKIIGVDSVIKKVFDKTLNMVVKKNESEIVIQPEGSKEKILVTVGKSTYAPKKKVLIKDAIDDSSYTVIVGQNFTVGNTELGKETFTLLNADANSGIAIIKSVGKDGKEYKISREQMEKPGAEGKKKKPDMMDPGMMMPGEEFPGGLPRDLKRKKEYLRGKNRNRPTGFPEL
jgi:hypothetical protein